MNWPTWFGFAAASLVMGLIPGPGVMSIVGYALSSGRKTALASVAGMACGNGIAMTLSLSGVGAILATSALAFTLLKWAGALYLVALGTLALVNAAVGTHEHSVPTPTITPRAAFLGNVAIGTFHPKTIVFFVAFVPQFITANHSYTHQVAVLTLTFCAIVAFTDAIYALAASKAARLFHRPDTQRWANYAGGSVLVAAGVATAAARK